MDPFFIKNLVYGIEDSLISTTGVLIGTSFAQIPNDYIILSGFILILVNALSMSYGSFISDESFMQTAKEKYTNKRVLFYSLTMFIAYIVAGIVVLIPYILKLEKPHIYSIILVVICLFLLFIFTKKTAAKTIILTLVGLGILLTSIKIGTYLKKIEDRLSVKK